ncbi:hypothetical protein [Streptomyces sp. NPDC017993]|uniref:hypothetical protein n=1 Tax=Streptomyces sp. NPDC017993 TaxID=3365027 RepID=UPI00379F5CF4
MRLHHLLPLSAIALLLLTGCADDAEHGTPDQGASSVRPSKTRQEQSASPPDTGRAWEPDDAMQRADRALDAYEGDGSHPELIDSGTAYITGGTHKKFQAPGKRWYRLDITCNTRGVDELTLTLSRGSDEQAYAIGCGDAEADQFNIPPGDTFIAHVDPVKDGTGLFKWRLNTVAEDNVDGCDDDIDGCDG